MTKNVARDCAFPVLRDIFIRHSAVLSLKAVLLRKVPNDYNTTVGLWEQAFNATQSWPGILKSLHQIIRELTNRQLLHDNAVRLRDMLTAHASLSTCRRLAKVDDVIESDLPASLRQEDVRLVFKVFFRYLGYFCQII